MQLHWIKCKGDKWCQFETVNLSAINAYGVYIIWHGGEHPRVVYVGQGDVAERIADHRTDQKIKSYAQKGILYVTWASVPVAQRNGIERYLADKFCPLEGEHHPLANPVFVNSPWD